MSTTDTRQFRKQKQKELRLHPISNGTERLKTVVRRLPPNLPEEIFWQSVQSWVTDDTVTWRSYYPGKLRTKRVNKESIPSRAYIAFKNEEYVATFGREYDGHLFKDKAGNESYAVVEFAPFQKVPAEKKKADARNNTIDRDEDYLSFLEVLKNTAKTESVSLETLIAASQPPPPPTTTPLLEALKAEKSAQKDKETILRNHAHYKDAAASAALLKKEEVKKKAAAAAAAQAAKQPEPPAPLSKKAKKAAAAATAAAQKASLAQDGQGPSGKSQPAGTGTGVAPPSAKLPTPASTASRSRPLREPHGRPQLAKGDNISATVPTSVSVSGPGVTTENVSPSEPVPVQGQGQRRNRPVVGLGRQFEAALNGAGVAVAPGGSGGDRKKRDKGGESLSLSGPGPGPVTEGGGKGGKHQRREEQVPSNVPVAIVPSILQRPEAGGDGGAVPDAVVVQRPPSSRGTEGPGGYGEGVGAVVGGGAGAGRGGSRRGRGRGRGGPRGG